MAGQPAAGGNALTRTLTMEKLAAAWARLQSLRGADDAWEYECAAADLTEARRELRRWSLHGNRRERKEKGLG